LDKVLDNIDALLRFVRKRRYTDLLKDKDLSNVTYVHARFEEASGRSNQTELEFAKSKGMNILESFGDHHSMLAPHYLETMYDLIVKGAPLKPSVAGTLSNIIETEGVSSAVSQFDNLLNEEAYLSINEEEMNLLGYYLIEKKKLAEAIEIFKLNVRSFPDSWNAYDSLGEAYLKNGDKVNAKKNYEKSLELNPENQYGIDALEKMKSE